MPNDPTSLPLGAHDPRLGSTKEKRISLDTILKIYASTPNGKYYQHQIRDLHIKWAPISHLLAKDPDFIEFFNTHIQPLCGGYSLGNVLVHLKDIFMENEPKQPPLEKQPGEVFEPYLHPLSSDTNRGRLLSEESLLKGFNYQEDHNGTMPVDDIPIETFSLQHMFEFNSRRPSNHTESSSYSRHNETFLDSDCEFTFFGSESRRKSQSSSFPLSVSPTAPNTRAAYGGKMQQEHSPVPEGMAETQSSSSYVRADSGNLNRPESVSQGAPMETTSEFAQVNTEFPIFYQNSHYSIPSKSVYPCTSTLSQAPEAGDLKALAHTRRKRSLGSDATESIGYSPHYLNTELSSNAQNALPRDTFDWVVDQLTVSSRYGAEKRIPSDQKISFKLESYIKRKKSSRDWWISRDLDRDKRIDDPLAWVHFEVSKLMPQWREVIESTELMGDDGPGIDSIYHEIAAYSYFSQFVGDH